MYMGSCRMWSVFKCMPGPSGVRAFRSYVSCCQHILSPQHDGRLHCWHDLIMRGMKLHLPDVKSTYYGGHEACGRL
jgi:hypothetical protein